MNPALAAFTHYNAGIPQQVKRQPEKGHPLIDVASDPD
jgi:hypothetical protein